MSEKHSMCHIKYSDNLFSNIIFQSLDILKLQTKFRNKMFKFSDYMAHIIITYFVNIFDMFEKFVIVFSCKCVRREGMSHLRKSCNVLIFVFLKCWFYSVYSVWKKNKFTWSNSYIYQGEYICDLEKLIFLKMTLLNCLTLNQCISCSVVR